MTAIEVFREAIINDRHREVAGARETAAEVTQIVDGFYAATVSPGGIERAKKHAKVTAAVGDYSGFWAHKRIT
jgi:hypothetical protein